MTENPREAFDEYVRELRESHFDSPEAFLEESGLTPSYLHYLERGEVLPDDKNLKKLEALASLPEERAELYRLWEVAEANRHREPWTYPGRKKPWTYVHKEE